MPSSSISRKRRFGIRDPADGVAELFEQAGADGCDVRIVFDQQHGAAAAGFGGIGVLGRGRGFLARQQDRDRGALAEFACDLDRSAGLMREAVNLRKPQAGALADRLGREEGIEDLAEHVGRDAGAGICHGDRDIFAGIGLVAERRRCAPKS